jgi:hypothetical protein
MGTSLETDSTWRDRVIAQVIAPPAGRAADEAISNLRDLAIASPSLAMTT